MFAADPFQLPFDASWAPVMVVFLVAPALIYGCWIGLAVLWWAFDLMVDRYMPDGVYGFTIPFTSFHIRLNVQRVDDDSEEM